MATVNGIFDLPGFLKPPIDPGEPSRTAVPRYFADFERHVDLPILRPVTVTAVRRADTDPAGDLVVESSHGTWVTRAVINATGTWTNPVRPRYPGQETFAGIQLHTSDYVSADRFAGLRVAVVGGGISALQQLEEISRVATTFWYTRREPVFRDGGFNPEVEGREIIAKVVADVEAGRPPAASSPTPAWRGRRTPWPPRNAGRSNAARCSRRSSPAASGRRTARSPPSTRSCGRQGSRRRSPTWTRSGSVATGAASVWWAPRSPASRACT